MNELKVGEVVPLTGGATAKVIKELGRGGQGIVYLVEVKGEKKALKWYHEKMKPEFRENLSKNLKAHIPSPAFLWPEYLTEKAGDYFGYVMRLRPEGYEEFGQYLLAHVHFRSFDAMLTAANNICESFDRLHSDGLRPIGSMSSLWK